MLQSVHAFRAENSCTSGAFSRPMQICTRRRWPSETLCMRHSGSMSNTFMTLSRLAESTPGRLLIICIAGISPCSVHSTLADAFLKVRAVLLGCPAILQILDFRTWITSAMQAGLQALHSCMLQCAGLRWNRIRLVPNIMIPAHLQGYTVASKCYVAVPVASQIGEAPRGCEVCVMKGGLAQHCHSRLGHHVLAPQHIQQGSLTRSVAPN